MNLLHANEVINVVESPFYSISLPWQIPHNPLQLPIHLVQFLLGQSIYAVNRQSVGCYFSVCEDGLFATDGGAVSTARLQIFVYCVTHGELSHACLCPVDKGIYSGFSCLAIFVVCHNPDVLSLLKKFDTYPNGDFNQDDCPT